MTEFTGVREREYSRSITIIVFQYAAESTLASDFTIAGGRQGNDSRILERLVGAFLVVVSHVFSKQMAKVGNTEYQKMVEAFPFQRSNPGFRVAVEIRCTDRKFQWLAVRCSKDIVKLLSCIWCLGHG